MLFSKTAVHGIHAICYLSTRRAGEVVPSPAVPASLGLTRTHTSKVLKRLASAGVVSSVRGRLGGCALSRKLGEIRTVEALDALNPLQDRKRLRAEICTGDTARMCDAHRGLPDLDDRVRKAVARDTREGMAGSGCVCENIKVGASECGSKEHCTRSANDGLIGLRHAARGPNGQQGTSDQAPRLPAQPGRAVAASIQRVATRVPETRCSGVFEA